MHAILMHKWKVLLIVLLLSLAAYVLKRVPEPAVLISVGAVHYFPPEYRVDEFYINRHYFGSSSFDGFAGGGLCCMWLPEHWKPGITVDVSWAVSDWSLTPIEDKANFDRAKIRDVGMYRAKVPVEKYEEPNDLYVHFFDGGRVRVSPGISRFADRYAMKSEIEAAAQLATQGTKVTELLTPQDIAALNKEVEEHRKKYGDWR